MVLKTKNMILNQLEIAAAALETAFSLLREDEEEVPKKEMPTECQHPEDARENCSTSGTNRFICKICGELVEKPM